MLKKITRAVVSVGISIGSALAALRLVLGWFGELQSAKDIFDSRGPIMELIGRVVFSGALWPTIAVACFIVYLLIEGRSFVQRRRRLRDEAASRPKKMGFAEALTTEDDSIPIVVDGVPRLLAVVSNGVKRQEAIKRQQASLNATQPGARRRFSQSWVDHARNIRHTAAQLRKAIEPMVAAAQNWKDSQARIMDWQRQKQHARPPERWIDGYDVFVSFRENVRKGAAVFRGSESRWSQEVRDMHRDLDAAVSEHAVVAERIAMFFDELAGLCTMMIDAVDNWNRRTWLSRALASLWQRLASWWRRMIPRKD